MRFGTYAFSANTRSLVATRYTYKKPTYCLKKIMASGGRGKERRDANIYVIFSDYPFCTTIRM